MSVYTKFTRRKPLVMRFRSSTAMISLASVLTFSILFSCQKNRADTIASTPAQIETLANKWLDSKQTVEPGERNQRVEQIRNLLDFSNSYSEDAGKGKTYLIIPIKEGFVSAYNKGKAPQNYLLLTQNFNGKVIKGNIVQFVSSAKKIPANTFRAMDELKKVAVDGSFTFLTLFDRYLYSETYKNGKFFSFTEVSDKNKATTTPVSTESIQTNGMVCTDWWLVTTEYYTDGSTNVYSEYLGQTCVGDGGGCLPNEWCTPQPEEGGGGGEGGNTTYQDDIEYDKKKRIIWTVFNDTGLVKVESIEIVKGKPEDTPHKGKFTLASHEESFIAGNPFNWSWLEMESGATITGHTAHFSVGGWLMLQFFDPEARTGDITTSYEVCFP